MDRTPGRCAIANALKAYFRSRGGRPTLGESLGIAAEVAHGSGTDVPPARKQAYLRLYTVSPNMQRFGFFARCTMHTSAAQSQARPTTRRIQSLVNLYHRPHGEHHEQGLVLGRAGPLVDDRLCLAIAFVQRPRKRNHDEKLKPVRLTPSQLPLVMRMPASSMQKPLVGLALKSQRQPNAPLQFLIQSPSRGQFA